MNVPLGNIGLTSDSVNERDENNVYVICYCMKIGAVICVTFYTITVQHPIELK